jgi:hypothetical protein
MNSHPDAPELGAALTAIHYLGFASCEPDDHAALLHLIADPGFVDQALAELATLAASSVLTTAFWFSFTYDIDSPPNDAAVAVLALELASALGNGTLAEWL